MSLKKTIWLVALMSAASMPALADESGPPQSDTPAATMPGMDHGSMPEMDHDSMPGMDHGSMSGMDHGDDEMGMMHPMLGMYGPYAMSREASGTSWQPDSTPNEGIHMMADDWTLMFHGYVNGIYDHQGGARGDNKAFSTSMGMAMAQRPLGIGTLGLRAMMSLDPLMGPNGYPLLLATGETGNGTTPLTDRQHPHDLFMELATSYSVPLSDKSSAFVYLGYPGEPALGPPAFMHRFSGADNPEAPITHHWLDSTHIVFGVATLGYVYDKWKIEGSVFSGREPDQNRWDFEPATFDSGSMRLTFNPSPDWSLQTSYGHLHSPEQLHPDVNENRVTASASYNKPFGDNNWATTFAWGRRIDNPGHRLDGFMLESAVTFAERHTVFGRAERVDEDELFEDPSPLAGRSFTVNKLSLGYIYDIPIADHLKAGIGGLGSTYALPDEVRPAYGGTPFSYMIFMRLKII